jgi:hypothetical protein
MNFLLLRNNAGILDPCVDRSARYGDQRSAQCASNSWAQAYATINAMKIETPRMTLRQILRVLRKSPLSSNM